MNIDSICHTCARRDCPDLYILHKYMVKYKGMEISINKCPLYVYGAPDQPQDDDKPEWA